MKETSSQIGTASVFWDSLALSSAQAAAVVLGIAVSSLTVRLLGPEEFGYLSVFTMFCGFFSLFTGAWTSGALVRFGREEYHKTGNLNHTVWARYFMFAIAVGIALVIVLPAGKSIGSYIGQGDMLILLPILLVTVLYLDTNSSFFFIFQAAKMMKTYALFLLLPSVVIIAGLGFLLLSGGRVTFIPVAATTACCGVLSSLLIFFALPKRRLLPVVLDKAMLKEIYLFSYPIFFGNMAFAVINWTDMVVIKHFCSMKDVGVYQTAYNIYNMTVSQFSIISSIALPIFVSMITLGKKYMIREYIRRFVPQLFLAGVLVVSCGASIAPFFFSYVYGAAFEISARYFSILSFALTFNLLIYLYGSILIACKHTKFSTVVLICMACLNLGGDILLVPLLGPTGATLATSGSVLSGAVLYHIFIKAKFMKASSLFCLLLLTLPMFISLAIIYFSDIFLAPPLVVAAVGISGFLLAKALRLFRMDDLALLEGISMPEFCRKLIFKIYRVLSV